MTNSGPPLSFKPNRILRMDAIEGMKKLASDSIDLIVTDPPYNIAHANKVTIRNGTPISTMKAWGAWDCLHPFDYDVFIMQILSECYRVLKPGGALYLFTATENNGYFIRKAELRGLVHRNQLIMLKRNPQPSLAKSNWRRAFETCMYVTKGKPAVFNFLSQTECVNAFPYAVGRKATTHPTEKPLAFIERIIAVSSKPDDLVLDPFMGSGTTAVACKRLGRRFLGFETNPDYVSMARQRIRTTPDRSTNPTKEAHGAKT